MNPQIRPLTADERRALAAARVMPSTHSGESVPMLIVSAPATTANWPDSSGVWTMAGEAPAASSTLAAKFIAT